jgi:gamma-butyrobetaine dioxygenase
MISIVFPACRRSSALLARRNKNHICYFATSSFHGVEEEFSPRVNATVDKNGRRLVLSGINTDMTFDAAWLWCNDALWVHPTSGQRLRSPAEYNGERIHRVRVLPRKEAMQDLIAPPKHSYHPRGGVFRAKYPSHNDDDGEDWMIEIEWTDGSDSSYFFVHWMLEQQAPTSGQVTPAQAIGRNSVLTKVDYQELLQDEMVLLDLYDAIFSDGAAIVQDCPCNLDDPPVSVVGKLLGGGSLSHGYLYDDVFHVQSIPDAHNVAYTSLGLPPHQDLAYYESPPGLQLLHCVEMQHVKGGASTLVDGMAAAHQLSRLAPDLFEILVETEATFCKQREGAQMKAHMSHIQQNPSGEIVGIRWSPPFEGPLRKTTNISDYYTAYAAYARLVNKTLPVHHYAMSPQLCRALNDYAIEHTYERQLQEGDLLIFNNQRMLHGRTQFAVLDMVKGGRHLVGCYTNMNETLSEYYLSQRKQGRSNELKLNVGNGTTV